MLIENGETDEGASIELTPLIDIVFLLLTFFLVATTFHQIEREMQIALPFAGSAGPITTALRELVVNIDEDGRIIVSGRQLEPDALAEMVLAAVEVNPEQKVTVRGDKNTAYANVVRVLDICKTGGIQEPYLDTVLE